MFSINDFGLVSSITNSMASEIARKREEQLKERLAQLGYVFNNPLELELFIKQRLTSISYTDKRGYNELFLDYRKPNEILIAAWGDNIEVKIEGNRVTAISG